MMKQGDIWLWEVIPSHFDHFYGMSMNVSSSSPCELSTSVQTIVDFVRHVCIHQAVQHVKLGWWTSGPFE